MPELSALLDAIRHRHSGTGEDACDAARLLAAVDAALSLADTLAAALRVAPRTVYEGGYEDAERQIGKVLREDISRALLGPEASGD